MAQGTAVEAVVFDMGGVLVELGPLTEILGDDPLTPEEFWPRWLASPTVRDFERGRCAPEVFGARLVAELGLSFDGAELVRRFANWPKGLFPGAAALVREVGATGVEVGVLSNTNELHWNTQRDHETVRGLFTRSYLSYEMDEVKPDPAIFEAVIADLGAPAGSIVYLDDNQPNVDGALACGLDAVRTVGVGEARIALAERGVVALGSA